MGPTRHDRELLVVDMVAAKITDVYTSRGANLERHDTGFVQSVMGHICLISATLSTCNSMFLVLNSMCPSTIVFLIS